MSNMRSRHLAFGGSKPPPAPTSSTNTLAMASNRSRFHSPVPSVCSASSSTSPRLFASTQQLKSSAEEDAAAPILNRASDLLATYSDFLKAVVAVCGTGNILCHLLASGPLAEALSLPQREMAQGMRESWEELNVKVSDQVAAIHMHTLSSFQEWITFNQMQSTLCSSNREDLSKLLGVCLTTFLQLQQHFSVLGGDKAGLQVTRSQSKQQLSASASRTLARSASLEESLPSRERRMEDTIETLEGERSDCEGGLKYHLNMLMTRIGGRMTQQSPLPASGQFYTSSVRNSSGHSKDDGSVPRRLSYSGPQCNSDADAPLGRRWSVPGSEVHPREHNGSQTTWYLGLSSLSIDTDSVVLPETDSGSCQGTVDGCLASTEEVDRVIRLLSCSTTPTLNCNVKEENPRACLQSRSPLISGAGSFDWVWQPSERRLPCSEMPCNGHDMCARDNRTSPYSRLYSWARTDSCSSSEEGMYDTNVTSDTDTTVIMELDSISAIRRRHSSGGAAISNGTCAIRSTRTRSIDDIEGVEGVNKTSKWPLKQLMDTNSLYSSTGVSIWTPAPLDYLSVPGYGN